MELSRGDETLRIRSLVIAAVGGAVLAVASPYLQLFTGLRVTTVPVFMVNLWYVGPVLLAVGAIATQRGLRSIAHFSVVAGIFWIATAVAFIMFAVATCLSCMA